MPSIFLKAFFQCWTRKEAFIKMLGIPAWKNLTRCPVFWPSLEPDHAGLSLLANQPLNSRWSFVDDAPSPEVSLALICKSHDWKHHLKF